MKPLVDHQLGRMRGVFRGIRDPRKGSNRQYAFDDILMAAFSVFFMQSPSFLDHQRMAASSYGRHACDALFGVDSLPSDNHIRQQLDRIGSSDLLAGFDIALETLREHRAMQSYQVLGGRTLIALDGSEFHNSRKVQCPKCQKRVRNRNKENEYTEYYHSVLAASMVSPGHNHALPLRPEFITPQDGNRKQDCEIRAAYRWLDNHAPHYASLQPVYLGDDLYAKQPMCRKILNHGSDFLLRVKAASHTTLFDYLHGLELPTHTRIEKTPGKNKPNRKYRYRWSEHKLPLTADREPLEVYYLELEIRNVGQPEPTACFRFITSLKPDADNIEELVRCGRARWKIENGTFNLLKNQGYHAEHDFGHGEKGLSNVLLTLNLLAFALHSACDQACQLWIQARNLFGRRIRFFLTLDSITAWQYFNSWHSLLTQIVSPHLRNAQGP